MAYKMKGHTLPGINQKSEGKNLSDGRAKSSALQKADKPTEAELIAQAEARFGEGVILGILILLYGTNSQKNEKKPTSRKE